MVLYCALFGVFRRSLARWWIGFAGHIVVLREALLELVHAAGGVDEHHLAGVVRVAGIADVELDQRVLVAVLPLDGVLRVRAALAEEHVLVAHVLEHDYAVAIGMEAWLHGLIRIRGANVMEFGKWEVFGAWNQPQPMPSMIALPCKHPIHLANAGETQESTIALQL